MYLGLVIMVLSCSGSGDSYPPPGGAPSIRFQNYVELGPGEATSISVLLTIRRPEDPTSVSYKVFRARKVAEYSPWKGGVPYEKLSMPPGLDISINPSDFVAYPKKTYKSTMEIKTSPKLPEGEYQLFLEVSFNDERWPGSGWITVNVK